MAKNDENLLDFETAMRQFSEMFPDQSAQLIESVLRKHDGNVAQTIEELLARNDVATTTTTPSLLPPHPISSPSSSSSSYAPSTSRRFNQEKGGEEQQQFCEEKWERGEGKLSKKAVAFKNEQNYSGGSRNGRDVLYNSTSPERHNIQQKQQQQQPTETTTSNSSNKRDPCADDEKIALLIQNREFLSYLRHDPHFQRAVIGRHQASARHAHRYPLPPGPSLPQLISCSRPSHSPNTGRLFPSCQRRTTTRREHHRHDRGGVFEEEELEGGEKRIEKERTDTRKLAIPEGPLVEYTDAEKRESGWSGRLKSKLSKCPPKGSEQLPSSPLLHHHFSTTPSDEQQQEEEEQTRRGVQAILSKGGRGLIEGLARKFSKNKCCKLQKQGTQIEPVEN